MRRDLPRPRLLFPVARHLVKVEDEPAALQAVLAPVDADARQPGLEGRAQAEVFQVLVRLEEALLRRAVRLSVIAQEAVGNPGDPLLIPAHEILEGLGLSGADLLDQPGFIDAGIRLTRNHREWKSGHIG